MAFPEGIRALAEELQRRGFTIESKAQHEWPRGGEIELEGPGRGGVRRVRMVEDRGVWEVQVMIGRGWYDPQTSLLAIQGRPHQRRAMSHVEWSRATLGVVDQFDGSPRQTQAIKAREKELAEAYTRWAEGKSESNPLS